MHYSCKNIICGKVLCTRLLHVKIISQYQYSVMVLLYVIPHGLVGCYQCFTLKVEAIDPSKILVTTYNTTQHYSPEIHDWHLSTMGTSGLKYHYSVVFIFMYLKGGGIVKEDLLWIVCSEEEGEKEFYLMMDI